MTALPPLGCGMDFLMRMAIEAESAKVAGLQHGLTEAEVAEVVDAFAAHHRTRPSAFSWPEVTTALIRRAADLEWRP